MADREELIQVWAKIIKEWLKVHTEVGGVVERHDPSETGDFLDYSISELMAKLLDLKQPCPECGGYVWKGHNLPCPTCHGTGLSGLPVVGILKAQQTFPGKIKE